MPSLERFTNPQVRPFGINITTLPGAKLYFYAANSTTPVNTYADKQGAVANTNPVVADANGIFPPIFLQNRLYRVTLTTSKNIVQPGWPIDNVGQDTTVVPFGPWVEIFTYAGDSVVTGSDGGWYRSKIPNNLGFDPVSSPTQWESIPIPVASNFISNVPFIEFADNAGQVELQFDKSLLGVGGLTFGNSPIAGATVMDWYEEGSFTPVASGSSATGSGTYTLQQGTYTRIGNRVFFDINISWSAHTGIGPLVISGLPFASSKECVVFAIPNNIVASGSPFGLMTVSSTIEIKYYDSAAGTQPPIIIDPAGTIQISGTYQAA